MARSGVTSAYNLIVRLSSDKKRQKKRVVRPRLRLRDIVWMMVAAV